MSDNIINHEEKNAPVTNVCAIFRSRLWKNTIKRASNVDASSRNAISDVLKRLQTSGMGITIKRKAVQSAASDCKKQKENGNSEKKPMVHELELNGNEDLMDGEEDVDFEGIDDQTKTNDVGSSPNDESKSPDTKTNATSKKSMPKTIIVNVEAPPIYVCLMCQAKFPSFDPLKEHMKNNKRCKEIHLKCDKCEKIFDTRKGLQQHIQTHRAKPTLVCEQCGKTFAHQFNLENHKSSQHGEYIEDVDSIYRCKECDDQFTSRRDLYEHISKHSKEPTPVLCDYCGRSFKSSESLRSHIRIHQDIRPHPCTYCAKRFRSRLQMTQHLHVHTGVKLFKCTICNREFAKKDSLVAHMRTHTGELPYQCSYCSDKFSTISKRKTHYRIQHAQEMPDGDETETVQDVQHAEHSNEVIQNVLMPYPAMEDDVEALDTTAASYVTYSTAFIDSDNILVFQTPVNGDIPLDDVLNGASTLAVIQ